MDENSQSAKKTSFEEYIKSEEFYRRELSSAWKNPDLSFTVNPQLTDYDVGRINPKNWGG